MDVVYIANNKKLKDITALISLTETDGSIGVYNNPVLSSLNGLNSVKKIGWYLDLNNNNKLKNFKELANLVEVHGIFIVGGKSLVSIEIGTGNLGQNGVRLRKLNKNLKFQKVKLFLDRVCSPDVIISSRGCDGTDVSAEYEYETNYYDD